MWSVLYAGRHQEAGLSAGQFLLLSCVPSAVRSKDTITKHCGAQGHIFYVDFIGGFGVYKNHLLALMIL